MRQAVVVIHGIGEQRPLDTLRSFVSAVSDDRARSKPDRLSESFELRRLALPASRRRHRPTTDFYELYWAHQIPAGSWSGVFSWMRRLLVRRPSSLTPGLRPLHRLLIGVTLLGLTAFAFSVWNAFAGDGDGFATLFTTALTYAPVVVVVVQLLVGRFFLRYAGDAAQYLTPTPDNIEARSKVRAQASRLLRRLHEDGGYSRVVVVGHSLGSVIGYEALNHLWDELRMPDTARPHLQPIAAGFEADVDELDDATRSMASRVEQFQQRQHRLWREQREGGTPWLVTDFVTLGSPLAHAELLFEHPTVSFRQRQEDYELPSCPPTGEAHYTQTFDVVAEPGGPPKWTFRIPTHGAVFCSTRWTNLFVPHRRLVMGDIVGGPIGPVLGAGIRDVPVSPSRPGWWERTLAAHTNYWTQGNGTEVEVEGTRDSIVALRAALRLDALRSKDPWPEP